MEQYCEPFPMHRNTNYYVAYNARTLIPYFVTKKRSSLVVGGASTEG